MAGESFSISRCSMSIFVSHEIGPGWRCAPLFAVADSVDRASLVANLSGPRPGKRQASEMQINEIRSSGTRSARNSVPNRRMQVPMHPCEVSKQPPHRSRSFHSLFTLRWTDRQGLVMRDRDCSDNASHFACQGPRSRPRCVRPLQRMLGSLPAPAEPVRCWKASTA